MAEQGDSDRDEDLSPIIPIKEKRKSIFHRGPTSHLTSRLLPTRQPVEEDEISLYYMLKAKRSVNINNIVNEWVKHYELNKEEAFLKLIQLILNAAGKIGTVTSEIMYIENCDSLLEMPTDSENKDGMYPIIRRGWIWKIFNSNFINFLQELVKSCQNTIIYDGFLLDNLFSCLELLMNCLYRPFRHVAILTIIKLMTSIVDVVLTIINESEDLVKQYESSIDDSVLEAINVKLKELSEKSSKLKEIIKLVLSNILPLSYRDRYSAIRILTLSELSTWMEKFPNCFLKEKFLHYIGLLLHDKIPAVRSKSVEVLQSLCEHEEFKEELSKFTENFKTRLIFMLRDKKNDIIIKVIKLMKTMVFQNYPLSDDQLSYIYLLVFDQHRGISKMAGEFLDMMIVKTISPNNELQKSLYKNYIIYIVEFSIEIKLQKHNHLLIDSLIETIPVMKNWESYIELLYEGFDSGDESSDDHRELVLIDLMVLCIKQVATGRSPRVKNTNRQDGFNLLLKKSDDLRKMTLIFIRSFSSLLKKFYPNKEKISRLIEIPQYFDINEQIFIQQEEYIISILNDLKHIALTYVQEDILHNFTITLCSFSAINESLHAHCNTIRSSVIDECMKYYTEEINKLDQSSILSQNSFHLCENVKNLTDSLMVLSVFFEYQNSNKYNVLNLIYPFIQNFSEGSAHPNGLIYSLRCSYSSFIWHVVEIFDCISDDQISIESITKLQKILEKYIALYESIISHSPITRVRKEAFIIMCGLLLFYSEKCIALKENQKFNSLKYEPNIKTCAALNLFIQSIIFKENEEERGENLGINKKSLIAYSKLIISDIVPVNWAAKIIQHYHIWFDKYGSIIEDMLNYIFKYSKNSAFNIFMTSLQSLFVQIKETCDVIDTSAVQFVQLKNLAKKLASLFPLNDDTKNCIRMLHKNGILFSFEGWRYLENEDLVTSTSCPPPNLCFFEVLMEFEYKFSKADKKYILKILDEKVQNSFTHLQDLQGWHSFFCYRNTISHKKK